MGIQSQEGAEGPVGIDVRLERAFIGSLLVGGRQLLDDVRDLVDSHEVFVSGLGIRCFQVMVALASDGQAIDAPMVAAKLIERRWDLEVVGSQGGNVASVLAAMLAEVCSDAFHCDRETLRSYARHLRELAELRKLLRLCEKVQAQARLGYQDARGILDAHKAAVFALAPHNAERSYVEASTLFPAVYDELVARSKEPDGTLRGRTTGLRELDRVLSGRQAAKLYVVAGRPGHGKTSFVLGGVLAAIAGTKERPGTDDSAAIFSLEMPAHEIGEVMACQAAHQARENARTGSFSARGWSSVTEWTSYLARSGIRVDDATGITLEELRSKCLRIADASARERSRTTGKPRELGLVVVDYLQLMKGPRGMPREEAIGEISRGLKGLAKELRVAVVAVSQLNRALEARQDKRPQMSDLRESGAIEQDADVIEFVFREYCYRRVPELKDKAEIILAKQRGGRAGFSLNVRWEGWRTAFADAPEEEQRESDDEPSANA